jgi:site-specific recombinase XerC
MSEQETPPFSIQEGKGNLEIRFRWEGAQRSISSGTKDEKAAKARAPARIMAWIASRSAAVRESPFQAAAEEFSTEQYSDHKKDTVAEVDLILRRLAATFPELGSVGQLTPEVFRAKLSQYRGKAAPGYWTNILITTRKFCRWCVKRGYMAEDPTEGIPVPGKKKGKRRDVWEDPYFEEVCAVQTAFDRECLLVMRWSGLDSGDLHTFDPRKHLVRDEMGGLTFKKLREKAKGEEETVIQPVSSKIAACMEARLKSGEGYGKGYASVRSFTASLRLRVQSRMRRAGLPVRDLKSLRHTFATYHAERGVPLDVLRRWLGHSLDSRTLDRYYIHRASTSRYMD